MTSPPPLPPYNIQMLSMWEVNGLLDTNSPKLTISLIKEGCKVFNIPFVGGGIVWVRTDPSNEIEILRLKEAIRGSLHQGTPYIVAYSKEIRNHPTLSYYTIIAIKSSSVDDLKKAFKVHKLKAFL